MYTGQFMTRPVIQLWRALNYNLQAQPAMVLPITSFWFWLVHCYVIIVTFEQVDLKKRNLFLFMILRKF